MTVASTIQSNVDAVNKSIAAAQAANPSNTSTQGTSASLASLSSNFTNFISLLTTQLKNQDPTDPTDTNSFTQELIGFSQVQQSVDTNTNLTNLINLTKSAGINNSIGYVNQLVDASTDTINLKVGKGIPAANYTLPSNAKTVSVTIVDSTGAVVKTLPQDAGGTTAGKHAITWDGTDDKGNTVNEGDYKIKVTAVDDSGAAVTATTDVTDYVSSVDFANGVSTLYFGDVPITSDKILSIKGYYSQDLSSAAAAAQAAAAAAAAAAGTGTST